MSQPVPRRGRRLVGSVFAAAFLVYAYFMPRWADWNIDSRLDLVHAIVDQRSLRIDRFHQNTWDKAVFKGHYYSDKAPGTALLGVPIYAGFLVARSTPLLGSGIRALERNSAWNIAVELGKTNTKQARAPAGKSLGGCARRGLAGNVQIIPWGNRLYPPERAWALSKYVVSLGVDALASALFVAFFFWFLGLFISRTGIRLVLTALYAFATVVLPYSTVFYSHVLAGSALFMAFALFYGIKRRGFAGWWGPLAGLLLGFALLTEYTVLLVAIVVAAYGLWILRDRPRYVVGTCMLGAVPLVVLGAYNSASFGSPLDTGYSHDFCWSAAQAAGYAGFTYPHLSALFDLTFGPYRGLFYASPFLLLALPGVVAMWRRNLRPEAVVSLFSATFFIVAISAYWGWNGGRVDGPRYLVPIVPFLAFPVAFYLDAIRRRSVWWLLPLLTGLWSVTVVWVQFLGGALFPISWLRNPISDYSLPALSRNDIAPNAGWFLGLRGWWSLLPLALMLLMLTGWSLARERLQPSVTGRLPYWFRFGKTDATRVTAGSGPHLLVQDDVTTLPEA